MSLRPRSVPVVATSPVGGRLDVVLRRGQQARQAMTSVEAGTHTRFPSEIAEEIAEEIVGKLDPTLTLLVSVVPFSTVNILQEDVGAIRVEVYPRPVNGPTDKYVITELGKCKSKLLKSLEAKVVDQLRKINVVPKNTIYPSGDNNNLPADFQYPVVNDYYEPQYHSYGGGFLNTAQNEGKCDIQIQSNAITKLQAYDISDTILSGGVEHRTGRP